MNKRIIVLGIALLMIPGIMGSFTAAQEGQTVEELGQWISVRIIAMKFDPVVSPNTALGGPIKIISENDMFYFKIADQRRGIGKIISDLLYNNAVFYVPLSSNAVEISPDANGIYALNTELAGEYVLGFASAPIIQLPIIGKFLTPGFTESIVVVREVKKGFFSSSPSLPTDPADETATETGVFPYWIIAACAGVLGVAIAYSLLKKRKEANEERVEDITEDKVENGEETTEDGTNADMERR